MKTSQDIRTMVQAARTCMLSTLGPNARINTRPMALAAVDELNQIWFFTDGTSAKAAEIETNPQVTLAFANQADSEWIAIVGTGRIVHDVAKLKELWHPAVRAWFSDGIDTPGLALLCIEMHTAEYWESKGSRLATLIELAKAAITGTPSTSTEHAVVAM